MRSAGHAAVALFYAVLCAASVSEQSVIWNACFDQLSFGHAVQFVADRDARLIGNLGNCRIRNLSLELEEMQLPMQRSENRMDEPAKKSLCPIFDLLACSDAGFHAIDLSVYAT